MIRLGGKWIKGVILLLVLGSALESRAEELNPETTAVRYVFASSVEPQLYGWIQEELHDNTPAIHYTHIKLMMNNNT